jgi:undecaprenyl pyrophosphate phosphatase UppP
MDKTVKKELTRSIFTILVWLGSLVAIVFFFTKAALLESQSAAKSASERSDAMHPTAPLGAEPATQRK